MAVALTLPQSSPSVPAMVVRDRSEPRLSNRGRQLRNERESRLALRLRENLHRRKAQSRGRAAVDAAEVQETIAPAPDAQRSECGRGAGGEA